MSSLFLSGAPLFDTQPVWFSFWMVRVLVSVRIIQAEVPHLETEHWVNPSNGGD